MDVAQVAGGTARTAPAPALVVPAGAACARRRRTARWPPARPGATPGWRGDAAGDAPRLRRRSRPGPASRAARCARRRAGHRPQRVPDEQQHRAEQRDRGGEHERRGSACGPARATQPGEREPQRRRSSRPLLARRRGRRRGSTARSSAGGDVGVVGGDRRARSRTRRCSASIRSSTRSPVSESRWPVGSSQSSSSGRWASARAMRDALGLAAGELGRQRVEPCRRGRRARAARPARCRDVASGAARRRQRGEGDVLVGGEGRQQVRALEDVGDAARRARGRGRRRRARRAARPASITSPALGTTRPPSTCSSVVLPEPDGPEQRHALARARSRGRRRRSAVTSRLAAAVDDASTPRQRSERRPRRSATLTRPPARRASRSRGRPRAATRSEWVTTTTVLP